jgi:ribosomal protein S18 acetylase RimI-like enzyme
MSELQIAAATPDDVGEAVPLFDAYRQFYRKPPDVEGARRFLFARLSKGESVLFLARQDGRAVGFVHLYPVFSSVQMNRLWILNDLYVTPEARKMGVARALLDRARQLATETRADWLTLETEPNNATAQRLYQSLGWQLEEDAFLRYNLVL